MNKSTGNLEKLKNTSDRLLYLVDAHADGNMSKFAKSIDIKGNTFHGYCNGGPPKTDCLIRIFEKYSVNITWLLTGIGEPYINDDGTLEAGSGCADNIVELDHTDIIRRFQDKAYARDLNFDLVELEQIDNGAYREVGGYIRGLLRGIRKRSTQGSGYTGPERRQGGDRRQRGDPGRVPADDRRSGRDRRSAVGED